MPSFLTISESAAAMLGGHRPCRVPTINRFLATSKGKLMVLAVKPGARQKKEGYIRHLYKGITFINKLLALFN